MLSKMKFMVFLCITRMLIFLGTSVGVKIAYIAVRRKRRRAGTALLGVASHLADEAFQFGQHFTGIVGRKEGDFMRIRKRQPA